GTLTLGTAPVTRHTVVEADLDTGAAVAAGSRHPISRAVAAMRPGANHAIVEVREVAGKGIEGTVGSRVYRLGSGEWVLDGAPSTNREAAAWLSRDGSPAGWSAVADQIRPGAAAAMPDLSSLRVGTEILSGDRRPEVERV